MQNVSDSFDFGNATVRTTVDGEGQLWFVARDVAEALEYPEATCSQIIDLLQTMPDEWLDLKIIKGNTRLMLNVCMIFASAEAGAPLEQARLNI